MVVPRGHLVYAHHPLGRTPADIAMFDDGPPPLTRYQDLRVVHDGALGGDLVSGVRLEDGKWVLITYTWDSVTGTRRLHLNADIAAESNGAAWTLPPGGVPRQVYVGRTANYNQGADGVIDEVSIWNTFSSTSDVVARLDATPALVDVDPPVAPASLSVFELGFPVSAANGTGNAAYSARINLLWTPSVDNVAVTGYLVYRDIKGGDQDNLVGNITHASYRDAFNYTHPAAGGDVSITYRVAAYDAARLISTHASGTITLSPTAHVAEVPEPLEEDVYGGATNLRLAQHGDKMAVVLRGAATGYFHVDRLNTSRWWIVSPLGNPLLLRSVYHASRVDAGAKYQNSMDWGEATVRLLRSWGFNAVSEYASRYAEATNRLSGDRVRIPMTPHVQPAYYAVRRQEWAVKDLVGGTRADVYTGWRHSTSPDVFDSNLAAYVDHAFQTYGGGEYEWATGGNQEYIMAMHSDDLDYLFGFGAGVDFAQVIDGEDGGFAKSQPHLGFIVLITNAHQTSNADLAITYDAYTVVHSKAALVSFLSARYAGDITALNRAWHEHANYSGFASEPGGWGMGSGLADEDGTCPSASSVAGASCWLGTGSYRENSNLANVRPALMADMDAFLEHHVTHYLVSMRTVIAKHVPNRMYWGPTSLGGWGAPARRAIYQAAGQHLDAVGVGLGGADFDSRLAFVRTHLGADRPLVNWEGFKAQADSSMHAYNAFAAVRPHSDSQETRGVRYQKMLQSILLAKAPGGSVFPFIGFKWWELYDSSKEVANWGLVTRLGNAYDGRQARTGVQTCTAEEDLVLVGWECGGETANYGDMLTAVAEVNSLSLWIAAESAEVLVDTPTTTGKNLTTITYTTPSPKATNNSTDFRAATPAATAEVAGNGGGSSPVVTTKNNEKPELEKATGAVTPAGNASISSVATASQCIKL